MPLEPIGDIADIQLTEQVVQTNEPRAQMLSRRANNVDATVIESQANTTAQKSQMYDRRTHGNQVDT